jgi:acetyl-CoA carboxylase biotin carboxyl carrier protein
VDLKDIKAIIALMRKNTISEFEMEKEGFKIKLKRGQNGGAVQVYPDESTLSNASLAPSASALLAAAPTIAPFPSSTEIEIKAPMVGTFYRAPSPESAAYVENGTEINPEMVICIIEAMKVMNEIKAEVKGVVTQVLAENGKPVEFGQPLFKVRLQRILAS